ncbi:MAG: SPOR domain-containing protein [Hyphomicrobiaceae bacterium]
MSRAKGPNAQAGAPRWRNEPDQDAYNRSHGQHHPDQGGHDDGYAHQQPQSHFPHQAFRQLGGEREQPALSRGSLASLLNRTTAAQNPPPSDDRRRPAQQAPSGRWSGNADPSGYDLANYQPEQGHGRQAPAHDAYVQQGYDSAAAEGWTGGQWNGQQQGHQQTYGSMDDLAYDPRAGYDGHPPHDQDYVYEGEEADEPPARRGPRAMVVVGALVGAIAVGGGLAYGYKSFSGSGADGKTPLVRADKGPAKSKPTDPGGKDIAHTDKRFLNRIGEDRPAGTVVETGAVSDTDSNGAPRKVTTLVVNRDGSMGAANPVITPTQQQAGGGGSGVPGLFVEGLGTPAQRPPLRGTASSEGQNATQAVAPRVISRAEPIVEAKAEPIAEPQVRAPVKKVVPRDDLAAPAQSTKVASAAGTIPSASSGGNGFVPVLSSQKSRMDALKAFADMQQKYTDVLQGRAPDVREVDLGQKGVWHRLMLGPPGSREAASSVCTQLKAHGFTGCWITTY